MKACLSVYDNSGEKLGLLWKSPSGYLYATFTPEALAQLFSPDIIEAAKEEPQEVFMSVCREHNESKERIKELEKELRFARDGLQIVSDKFCGL